MVETKTAKIQSTKDFVAISDIRDAVLVLKDGSLKSVIEVSSMNFELKSLDEQTAIIGAFQNFLNSIDFPLQIAINSRKLDIGPYIKSLEELQTSITSELMKIQAAEYTRFIKSLTELANIMSKKFYVLVSLYAVEATSAATTKAGFLGAIKSVISPKKFAMTLTDEQLEAYKIQLNQRIQFVSEGINGLGLESKVLDKDALMNLFYSYYNPGHNL
jgi:hypothetical protein